MKYVDLDGFTRGTFTHQSATHNVYRRGSGPAVIVIAEMPGITPRVLEFATRVAEIGCTVVVPHLFGTPGRDPNPKHVGWVSGLTYTAKSFAYTCISREFTTLATGKSSPVVNWLRALAAEEHERCGGPGVGAVGMCFTGGYALSMAVDERLLVPVLAQPAMPLALTKSRSRSLDISPEDLAVVKDRCANNGLEVIGLRFRGDRLSPPGRFDFLREQLGESFIGVELDDDDASPESPVPAHHTVTEHLVDRPGAPTRQALDMVLDHLRRRLLDGSAA